MVSPYKIDGAIKFNSVLSKGNGADYVRPDVNNQDIAFLQYTGGTTGVSKGAMLTHGNMIANMEQISEWMKPKLKDY